MGQTTICTGKFRSRTMRRMIADLGSIFLSEESQVRLHDVEKLCDHRGHATKMSGPRLAAEPVAEAFDGDIGDRTRRIHLFHPRRKEQIHPFFFQQSAIAIKIARILGQIFVGSELKGIYEN